MRLLCKDPQIMKILNCKNCDTRRTKTGAKGKIQSLTLKCKKCLKYFSQDAIVCKITMQASSNCKDFKRSPNPHHTAATEWAQNNIDINREHV